MATDLPRILYLSPGPVYELEDRFGERLRAFSDWSTGVVVTSSPDSEIRGVGSWTIRTTPFRPGRRGRDVARLADQVLEEGSFNLIMTYDPLRTGLTGLRLARRSRLPLAVEINGDYSAPANYAERPPGIRSLRRLAAVTLERFVVGRAAGVKFLNEARRRALERFTEGRIVRMFPNQLDLSDFRPREETPVVLTVGYPYRVKGMDVLIEAFKRVHAAHPGWRLEIVGWYPDPAELNRDMAGHPGIVHIPAMPRAELADRMGRCGIFVLASRTEAMGRVLIEAMASAKPRIGTTVGGIPSLIDHGADGLLVEPDDPSMLAEALDRLMSDDELRGRLGDAAAARVGESFTIARYSENMREFVDAILADHP